MSRVGLKLVVSDFRVRFLLLTVEKLFVRLVSHKSLDVPKIYFVYIINNDS